ncbi:swib domain-containing protein [Cryptosporidium ubiquitum]|uniref:Swib domain-containing protein n=1 Tax=Cryptosporidium ubiquitum TaxID=857276 RepID=A0A1J4MKV5_9CRYT|nr:swib domain-containing protein [Cryptosporidium ubiquitum]OII74865.1 swib domain-containing protein [Cryptosporidium ubiquitum]
MGNKNVDDDENNIEIDSNLTKDIQIPSQVFENHFSPIPIGCLNFEEKLEESRIVKKLKAREKTYTVKTIIDKHVGTEWVNSRIMSNLIPSQDCIESQIAIILSSCNLNAITLRKLYALLSVCFNINLLNIDIQNIYQIIRENLEKLRRTDKQEIKKNKRVRDKKKIQIKNLTKFIDGEDTISLRSFALKIKQYCEKKSLIHPSNTKLFILDQNLRDIFPGRDSIGKNINDIQRLLKVSNIDIENEYLSFSEQTTS